MKTITCKSVRSARNDDRQLAKHLRVCEDCLSTAVPEHEQKAHQRKTSNIVRSAKQNKEHVQQTRA